MRQLMSFLRVLDGYFGKIAKAFTAIALCIQMIVVFIAVVFRYALNSPLTWSDELATYLLVIITFFGSYVALREKMLAKIDLLVDRLPRKPRLVTRFIAYLMSLSLLIAIVCVGSQLAFSPVVMKQTTPSMQLPMFWFFLIIPASAILMINHILIQAYDLFVEKGENSDEEKTGSYL